MNLPHLDNTDYQTDYQFRVRLAASIGEDVAWPDEDEYEDDTQQNDCYEPESGLFGDY